MDQLLAELICREGTVGAALRRRPRLGWTSVVMLPCLLVTVQACSPQPDGDGARSNMELAATELPAQPAAVVDSVFPVEEEIRRFQAGLPIVTSLSDGARSRDELVDRFLEGLERGSRSTLTSLLLTRSEFGYLVYPYTIYTRAPYRQSPAFVWFQMENATSGGVSKMFGTLAGKPLHATGYHCEAIPKTEGPNRVWSECVVTLASAEAQPTDVRLFGSILQRDGVFKFVSYSVDL